MRSIRSGVFVPAVLTALLLAGCSSTVAGSAAPEGGGPAVPSGLAEAREQAEDLAGGGGAEDGVDACAFLSAAEVESLIGPAVGEDAGGLSGSRCQWENPDTYDSVSLEIGRPGTAPGGQLAPWDASIGEERSLGDGVREGPGGGIEFVAGDRTCFLQVVTEDLGGSEDRATELEFAEVVRGKL